MKTMKIFRKTTLGFACRLVTLTVLLLVGGASVGMYAESIPWAKYENGTLTFFYGEKSSFGTDEYAIGSDDPGWLTDKKSSSITKVVFDQSFQNARPKSCSRWFKNCSNLTTIENIKYLNTSEVTDMSAMFLSCSSLKSLDLSNFNTEKVTEVNYMFCGCSSLQFLDLSNFNTENVKYTFFMFANCLKLEAIYASDKFTTDKVTSYNSHDNGMFSDCYSLSGDIKYNYKFVDKTYAKIDGGYFRDKAYENRPWAKYDKDNQTLTFQCGYKRVINNSNGEYELNIGSNYPGWITDHKTDITKVVFDKSFKIARPTTGHYWFYCENLVTIENISYLNTSEMTDMSRMFYDCKKLQSLDVSNFNTAKVNYMNGMFYNCSILQSLDVSNFNTATVENMRYMFDGCGKLQSLDVSNFNTAKVEDISGMFNNCYKLQSLRRIPEASAKLI